MEINTRASCTCHEIEQLALEIKKKGCIRISEDKRGLFPKGHIGRHYAEHQAEKGFVGFLERVVGAPSVNCLQLYL